MAVLTQTFESGSDGTAITTGNTAGGGNACSIVAGGAATGTFEATGAIEGSLSAKCTFASGEYVYVNMAGGGSSKGGFFAKHYWPAAPGVNTGVQVIRGTAKLAKALLLTSGKVYFENSNASQTYTTPSALTFPGVYWIDLAVDTGTTSSDGKIKFAVYDSGGSLAGGMPSVQEWTGTNAGGGDTIAHHQAGKADATAFAGEWLVDSFRAVSGAYSLAKPGTLIAPTADAGADQDAEPGGTITLDGSGSLDADGTISTYAWSQTAGTTVTLSSTSVESPTFTAPFAVVAGETLTFSLTVTDNDAQSSAADTCDVTVLPVTERVATSGAAAGMVPYYAHA